MLPKLNQPAEVGLDQVTLAEAVQHLCLIEPRFAGVLRQHGMPSLRQATGGLQSLLLIVTEQFLSLAAAHAIWQRLQARLSPFEALVILSCPQEELVALGLSRAKAQSFHGLATALIEKRLDFDALRLMDDDMAQRTLVALPSIGPWSADIYLLSCLLRADVWPWGDVALQNAAHDLFDLSHRPAKAEMLALGVNFRPYRAVAARLLWSHYRGLKGLKQA